MENNNIEINAATENLVTHAEVSSEGTHHTVNLWHRHEGTTMYLQQLALTGNKTHIFAALREALPVGTFVQSAR